MLDKGDTTLADPGRVSAISSHCSMPSSSTAVADTADDDFDSVEHVGVELSPTLANELDTLVVELQRSRKYTGMSFF